MADGRLNHDRPIGQMRIIAPADMPDVRPDIAEVDRREVVHGALRTRSPHDLSHTYATILLMTHISPAYVQKQLGHHSISMAVDIYGHWIPGEGRELLDRVLRPKAKPDRPLSLIQGYI